MMQFEVTPETSVDPETTKTDKAPSSKAVLKELFVLLEDYGPTWYTQEHHDRAVSALRREKVRTGAASGGKGPGRQKIPGRGKEAC